MKKALVLAALLTGAAHAQVVAWSANTEGGRINLTASQGACPPDKRAMFTTTPSGHFAMGCWALFPDNRVYVEYVGGGQPMLYDINGFTLVEPAARPQAPLPLPPKPKVKPWQSEAGYL